MRILGIETSCDETSVSIVEDGTLVRSCVISSSRKEFERVGGVIPEEAARKQLEVMLPVLERCLTKASLMHTDLDAIAVTHGPGLLGSLLVGTATARSLAAVWKLPLIPVHHTLGHLCSTWLTNEPKADEPVFPMITLSVSGGHSDLWYRTSHTRGILIGSTRDDAAGEAFDKGAVQLGLPYPGGPALAALADGGNEHAFPFPLPLHQEKTLDFSFSGLKTSLKYLLRDLGDTAKDESVRKDLAASYQLAICNHLGDRLSMALDQFPEAKECHIVGGVSANTRLRAVAADIAQRHAVTVRWPQTLLFCTDNGAMIASAGYFLLKEKPTATEGPWKTEATMNLARVVSA